MARVYKRSTGLTLLTVGASILLGLHILGLLTQITFLDYHYIINFYYIQNFIDGFLALIFLTGFIIFRKEFKERTNYAPKSVIVLIAGFILSIIGFMLNLFRLEEFYYQSFWLYLLNDFIITMVSPVLSLVGFALLSKEFTQHGYYIKATPTSSSTPYLIPTAPLRFCPSCGSQVFQDALFCQNCGKKLHT